MNPRRNGALPEAEPVRDWIESEGSLRRGAKLELQRIARRARSRWFVIPLLGALMAGAVVFAMARKKAEYRAEIALAIDEGRLAAQKSFLPASDLRNYVVTVLIPKAKVIKLVEAYDLFPARKRFGNDFAVAEFFEALKVEVSRNTLLQVQTASEPRSARVDLSYGHADPLLATKLTQQIADIVVETAGEYRQEVAQHVAKQVEGARSILINRLHGLELRRLGLQASMDAALASQRRAYWASQSVERAQLEREIRDTNQRLTALTQTSVLDALAQEISAAGQGVAIRQISEERPQTPERRTVVLLVVGLVTFLAGVGLAGMFLGAFDTRIRDTDDVRRLNLPVIGHLPSFPGHDVGSLKSRGAARARVPLKKLWR